MTERNLKHVNNNISKSGFTVISGVGTQCPTEDKQSGNFHLGESGNAPSGNLIVKLQTYINSMTVLFSLPWKLSALDITNI